MRIQSANQNCPSEKILARRNRCLWQLEIYESTSAHTCNPCRSKRGSFRHRNVDQTQNPLSVARFSWSVESMSGRACGWGSDCKRGNWIEWDLNRKLCNFTLDGPAEPAAAVDDKSLSGSSGAFCSSSVLGCTRNSRLANKEICNESQAELN